MIFIPTKSKNYLYILLFLSQILLGQKFEITGTIIDKGTQLPLPYVDVILKTTLGEIKTGVITDDNGYFVLSSAAGSFIVQVNYMGYGSIELPVAVDSNKDLSTLALEQETQQLEGVSVVARIPKIQKKGGVLTVNVENTVLSEIGDVSDVLRQTPSLSVTAENSIEVFGKGEAQIYLDGRRIENADELTMINSNNVAKIEVVRNPSAKYDAEGKAVVLITTTKNKIEGISSKIRFRYGENTFSRWLGGIDLNYKKDAVSLYSSYSYYPKKLKSVDEYFRIFENEDQSTTTMENRVGSVSDLQNVHNLRVGSNIALGKTQDLDIGLTYSGEEGGLTTDNRNVITGLMNQDVNVTTSTNTDRKNETSSFNVNYSTRLDTLGRKITFFSNYTQFSSSSLGIIDEDISNVSEDLGKENDNKNEIDVLATSVDYVHPFTESLKGVVGAKYSKISNASELRLFDSSNQIVLEQESFRYDENIYAGFFEIEKEYENLTASVGLRLESTTVNGISRIDGQTIIDSTYVNLFPSVAMNYEISEDWSLGVYYNKRIARPDVQDLNPFINFIDSFSSLRGNPSLRPEMIDEFETAIEYLEAVSLEVSYNRIKNPIYDFLTNEDFVTVSTQENFKSEEEISVGLNLPYENEWMSIYGYVGMSHVFNTRLFTASEFDLRDKTYWEFALQSRFYLPKKINLGVTYFYVTDQRDGIFFARPQDILNISAGKKMCNDNLSISLFAQDVFNTFRTRAEAKLDGLTVGVDQFRDLSGFGISLVYTINNNARNDDDDDDEDDKEELPELERIKKE